MKKIIICIAVLIITVVVSARPIYNSVYTSLWLRKNYPNCKLINSTTKQEDGDLFEAGDDYYVYTLYDKKNKFKFEQEFHYTEKFPKILKAGDENERTYRYLVKRKKFCEKIKKEAEKLCSCEHFTVDCTEENHGVYIFLKAPDYESLEKLSKGLDAFEPPTEPENFWYFGGNRRPFYSIEVFDAETYDKIKEKYDEGSREAFKGSNMGTDPTDITEDLFGTEGECVSSFHELDRDAYEKISFPLKCRHRETHEFERAAFKITSKRFFTEDGEQKYDNVCRFFVYGINF